MSIRIKTDLAITLLTTKKAETEALIAQRREELKAAEKAEAAFKARVIRDLPKVVKLDDINPGWGRITVSVTMTDMEWPEPRPYHVRTEIDTLVNQVDEMEELIKLLSLCDSTTINVQSGVLKRVAAYL